LASGLGLERISIEGDGEGDLTLFLVVAFFDVGLGIDAFVFA